MQVSHRFRFYACSLQSILIKPSSKVLFGNSATGDMTDRFNPWRWQDLFMILGLVWGHFYWVLWGWEVERRKRDFLMASRLIYVNLEVGHGFRSRAYGGCRVCSIPSFVCCYFLKKKKKKLKPRNEGKSETLGHCREDDTGNLTSSAHWERGRKEFLFLSGGRILNTACWSRSRATTLFIDCQ